MTDDIKPWTLKNITPEVRNAAVSAAERERVTIGEWVSRAILAKIQADRNEPRSVTTVGPAEPPAPVPAYSLTELSDIAIKISAAELAPDLRKPLFSVLKSAIKAAQHAQAPRSPDRAAPEPAPAVSYPQASRIQ